MSHTTTTRTATTDPTAGTVTPVGVPAVIQALESTHYTLTPRDVIARLADIGSVALDLGDAVARVERLRFVGAAHVWAACLAGTDAKKIAAAGKLAVEADPRQKGWIPTTGSAVGVLVRVAKIHGLPGPAATSHVDGRDVPLTYAQIRRVVEVLPVGVVDEATNKAGQSGAGAAGAMTDLLKARKTREAAAKRAAKKADTPAGEDESAGMPGESYGTDAPAKDAGKNAGPRTLADLPTLDLAAHAEKVLRELVGRTDAPAEHLDGLASILRAGAGA